uniref:Uncharacterized protein n=1 Tax=Candidatus Kentrum sp. LPFa TaxID=2126335 RepID=A0A450WY35_9GAMM|nr:MAG: hypothetical protein BECKLPF1236A_GA0070988_103253 [Candidatus Kentron sp. LPFa]VFK35293.1 MAG: hypothetical protein BECKLPF1236C_GA0070990_103562 [Candidatus Kentron sp. LPFa]
MALLPTPPISPAGSRISSARHCPSAAPRSDTSTIPPSLPALHRLGGVFAALSLIDLPAHDFAAVDVENQASEPKPESKSSITLSSEPYHSPYYFKILGYIQVFIAQGGAERSWASRYSPFGAEGKTSTKNFKLTRYLIFSGERGRLRRSGFLHSYSTSPQEELIQVPHVQLYPGGSPVAALGAAFGAFDIPE